MAKRKRKRDEIQLAIVVLAVSLVVLIALIMVMVSLKNEKPAQNNATTASQGNIIETTTQVENTTEQTQPVSSENETTTEKQTTSQASQVETTTAAPETSTSATQVETTTEVQTTTQAAPETTAAQETTTAYVSSNPMSKYPVHEGQWDLASLDNTGVGFGYSPDQRAANMVPNDWAYYESKWGMYNVDWIQDINSNTIYLTMDVGFANPYTEGIIDVLKEKNVTVVFFITKMFLDSSPDTVQRMLDEGHIIGNHTCDHPNMPTLSDEKMKAQITDLSDAMYAKFGYTMKLFRFPEGRFSHRTLAQVENLGMKTVFWSYAYNDYSATQPEVGPSLQKAIDYLHPGAIYLLHASSSTNAAFLGDWIDAARAAGYEFGVYPLDAN